MTERLHFHFPLFMPWRRKWQPTPEFLPGESHGRRSLVGCCLWGHTESDTTEQLHFHFPLSCIGEGNGNPLQSSCLENPMDGEAWQAAVHGVAQSRTWLKRLSSSSSKGCVSWPEVISFPIKHSGKGDTTSLPTACLNVPPSVIPSALHVYVLSLITVHVRTSPLGSGIPAGGAHTSQRPGNFSFHHWPFLLTVV